MNRALAAALLLALAGCGEREPPADDSNLITWRSILADVVEFDVSVLGASRLFSSSAAPVSLTGYAPRTFGDLDHGNFLEVRDVAVGVEATLAEMEGAGAITWIWSAHPAGTLILEIDGVVAEVSFAKFMKGDWLPTGWPFAAKTAEGWNLHFPLLHQRRCKVSVRAKSRAELGSLFYQIAWNKIEGAVEPFDMDSPRVHARILERLATRWGAPAAVEVESSHAGTIGAGDKVEVFKARGEGVMEALMITRDFDSDWADVWIGFYWDGAAEPALYAPLHMVCGVSREGGDVKSLPVSKCDRSVLLRWPMPFGAGSRIMLDNRGDKDVWLEVGVRIDHEDRSDERFHGTWVERHGLDLAANETLTLLRRDGAGRIVGLVLDVNNRSDGWWGEGDPMIWLDGGDQPAWRGTGTEDYFGFAWCSTSTFQHPLRSQTRAGMMVRYHLLDALPFKDSARFEFEVRGAGAGLVDYSALTLWYSATNSKND